MTFKHIIGKSTLKYGLMKYVPLDAKDRSYIGKHWNKRLLRGVQCILLVLCQHLIDGFVHADSLVGILRTRLFAGTHLPVSLTLQKH
jgi:hypothetical protein